MIGKKQNVCTRQQDKQANKFFCEIFVECMHFVFMLHIVFASPFFLKEVDANYPKKIFPKDMVDNHRDILEFCCYFFGFMWKLMVMTIEYMLLLLTECLNTTIEAVVDYVAKNKKFYLAKKSKDIASVAVSIA